MEAFLGAPSTSVGEASGVYCLEGMTSISDAAISLGVIQVCWRDAVAVLDGGRQ